MIESSKTYKKVLCTDYSNKVCKLSDECQKAHGLVELRDRGKQLEKYLIAHKLRNPDLTYKTRAEMGSSFMPANIEKPDEELWLEEPFDVMNETNISMAI